MSQIEHQAQKKILKLLEQLAKSVFDGLKTNATTTEINQQIIDELTGVMQSGADTVGVGLLPPDDMTKVLADFGALSQQSLTRLEKRATKVLTNYVSFVTDKINSLPDDDPAKKVFTDFYAKHGQSRARLISQQETKNAYQNGELDLAQNVDRWLKKNKPTSYIVKTWATTSDKPCPFCKKMDGVEAGIKDSFVPGGLIDSDDVTLVLDPDYSDGTIPDAHANCIIGDTHVLSPDLENIQRAYYSGAIVKIMTAKGRRLSVTPNHIVLTSRGWVAAKNLTKTDSVISYNFGEETSPKINPNDDKSPASIEQIFTSFIESGSMLSVSMPSTTKDFKGDGLSIQGNIDVISADRLLSSSIDVSFLECFENLTFANADVSSSSSLIKLRDLRTMLFALTLTSDSLVSFDELCSMLSGGELTGAEFVSFFSSSDYDLRLKKATADDSSVDLISFSDALFGLSRYITVDDVVDVEMVHYSGHVYDLSTKSTTYIANSIISSNCQCVFKFSLVSKGK